MERRLLRGIMNPAMIGVWIFGLALAWQGEWWHAGWWQMKFALVVGLTVVHHLYGRWRKEFEADRNTRPARYYRWWNEVPTVLMIAIVFLAVLKPSFARAEDTGFVPARLERIAPWYQAQIDKGGLTGAVVAIAHDGKLAYLQAIGTQDRARQVPMKTDSIFWIASMTKPVTSVAAMMLVEEGKLDLNAPIANYLPELKDRTVGGQPAKRQPQVVDLLRHTAGLTYPEEGDTPGHRRFDSIVFRRNLTLADLVTSLSPIPLLHEPGEVWEYSLGVDVLARIVEVVSGQPFDQFLAERASSSRSAWSTPASSCRRTSSPAWSIRSRRPAAALGHHQADKLFSGGGGLASTAPDYLRFCQMLLNGGDARRRAILSPATVKQMTTNTLPPETRFAGEVGQYVGPRVGQAGAWALRCAPTRSSACIPGAVGSYNWSGILGHLFLDRSGREADRWCELIQVPPDCRRLLPGCLAPSDLCRAQRAATAVADRRRPERDAQALFAGTYDFGLSLSARDRRAPIPAFAFSGCRPRDRCQRQGHGASADRQWPAARAGVIAGDVITEIDGSPVAGLTLDPVLAKLRGAPGTSVRLKLADKEVTVVRETIRLPGARLKVQVVDGELVGRGGRYLVGARLREGQAGVAEGPVANRIPARDRRASAHRLHERWRRQNLRRHPQSRAAAGQRHQDRLTFRPAASARPSRGSSPARRSRRRPRTTGRRWWRASPCRRRRTSPRSSQGRRPRSGAPSRRPTARARGPRPGPQRRSRSRSRTGRRPARRSADRWRRAPAPRGRA